MPPHAVIAFASTRIQLRVFLLGAAIITTGLGCAQSSRTDVLTPAAPVTAGPTQATSAPAPVTVERPSPAVVPVAAPAPRPTNAAPPPVSIPGVDLTAPHPFAIVPNDPNPRARSVWEAHETGRFPERLTPLVAPKPFDPAAWAKDPQAYLDVVEPGRVDQASTDPQAPPITVADAQRFHRVTSRTLTVLTARAQPLAPVSWATTRGGVFAESKAGAVTVRADADGLARVTYFASPVVTGETVILASSPMCAGQAEFIVFVDPPSPADAPSSSPR